MVKADISVLIEPQDKYASLPVVLVDIDNYLQKLGLAYEVLVLSDSEEAENIVKKFSKIVKTAKFKSVKDQELRQLSTFIGGKLQIVLKGASIPNFESVKRLIGSLHSKDNPNGAELSFAYGEDFKVKGIFFYVLSRLFGTPIRLDRYHSMVGFTAEISSSVLGLQKLSGEAAEIELAALTKRLGYKVAEIPVEMRVGEEARTSHPNPMRMLLEWIKIRFAIAVNSYDLKGLIKRA